MHFRALCLILIAVVGAVAGCTGGDGPEPTCTDGTLNQGEEDVDCGGPCPPCDTGCDCLVDSDCSAGAICVDCTCNGHCYDGALNGAETDTDCGGPCPGCNDGQTCASDADCLSNRCENATCVPPDDPCVDGLRNGDETDIDCGGSTCPFCADGQACLADGDCFSGWCDGFTCTPVPDHCSDGVQNQGEFALDCGGPCPACPCDCDSDMDCQPGEVCRDCVCQPHCNDGFQNGDETDVDCGGSCADCPGPCTCASDGDCLNNICIDCICVATAYAHCACITGGDNTGDGYAAEGCRTLGYPYQAQVHYCEDFDTDAYAGPDGIVGEVINPNWVSSCDHEWDPNGGYAGGAAKFTAHTFDDEQSDGLVILWPEAIASASQANVGYLFYMGPDWNDSLATTQEWKHTLLRTNDENGQTAMLMDWAGAKHIWSACSLMGGLCQDEFGDQWPEDANPHAFVPPEHEGEWLYVELEHIPGAQGSVNVYVYTRQGNVVGAGPMASIPSQATSPHVFNYARILAYMEGTCNAAGERQSVITQCTADSYAKIDLVRLGDAFIGPPAGFVQ